MGRQIKNADRMNQAPVSDGLFRFWCRARWARKAIRASQ